MQSVYRVIVNPYGYDYWSIFTKDEEIFNQISKFGYTDQAAAHFGDAWWDQIVEGNEYYSPPYILLGETSLNQHD